MGEILVGILAVVIYLALIGLTIWGWKEFMCDRNLLIFGLAIMLTIMTLIPVGFIYDEVQKSRAETKVEVTQVEVVERKYSPPRTNIISNGKTITTVYIAAKHQITITDGDYRKTIDNKEMYDKFEVGDRFEMSKIIYKNKNGKVFSKDFKFK